jgi:hypothetical protein
MKTRAKDIFMVRQLSAIALLLLVMGALSPAGAGRPCADAQACAGRSFEGLERKYSRPRIFQEPTAKHRHIKDIGKYRMDLPYDDQVQRRRRRQEEVEDALTDRYIRRKAHAGSDWTFDPYKHKRRHKKDGHHRFQFRGYWYAEPYWRYGYAADPSIGCSEGNRIVRGRGFLKVRTIECQGRFYTYTGWRSGETLRVVVDARTGRIASIRPN